MDEYLWHTCDILADLVEGRLDRRPLIASTARLGYGDRVLAVGPGQRVSWRALGDGSYVHEGGFAVGSPAFVLASMAATALTNSSRRNQAWRNAQPRWVVDGTSEITISVQGMFSAHPTSALGFYWQSDGWREIDLVGPDVFQTSFVDTRGQYSTVRIHTPWASLIFALVARASFPAHPRLLGRSWLPPDFEERCARMGRPCRPAAKLMLNDGGT
ncbi:hypothetical protein J1792_32425 [Streptomyces triculaminicus]|uniref:Uncharacterized protein n=1 Tax=Streptomyces triculaminicus TaxID=2816232 RepID=A0A939JQB3_9ACTN|nr:hypothetical protein [Streptomyces triculaminicus]MBO0657251.1 hypothetical protein [Streptomyces triculaminicus]